MKIYETRNEMINDLLQPDTIGLRVCEVGVFKGDFAEEILKTKPLELVLIDPWKGMNISGNADGVNVVSANLDEEYWRLCRKYENRKKVKLIRGLSYEVLEGFADNYFDAVYIDGDHSYAGVKKDLLVSLRKVKKNGILMLHDFDLNPKKCPYNYDFIPEINRAVKEFCKEFHYEIFAVANDGCMSCAIRV